MTAAYKRKLEEDKLWLAQEKIREAQEAKQDVVKAGHMGNFYKCAGTLQPGCVGDAVPHISVIKVWIAVNHNELSNSH